MEKNKSCVVVHAPAKLNLFLEVRARRDDGFHEIETLMTAVTLFDTLRFIPRSDGQLHVTCNWANGFTAQTNFHEKQNNLSEHPDCFRSILGSLPESGNNIVQRSLEELRVRAGINTGATIQLIKHIPSAAGLGGASSDAAVALLAANDAWRLEWPLGRLEELAADLGSDVPFFLTGGSAVCRGRGEQIQPIENHTKMEFVIVYPPEGLSTAEVYRHCRPADHAETTDSLLAAITSGKLQEIGNSFLNRLEPAAERCSQWIGRVRGAFEKLDCLGQQMSGSGSSYFGLCRNARHASRIANRLRAAAVGTVFRASTYSGPIRPRWTQVA